MLATQTGHSGEGGCPVTRAQECMNRGEFGLTEYIGVIERSSEALRLWIRTRHEYGYHGADQHQGHSSVHGAGACAGEALQPHGASTRLLLMRGIRDTDVFRYLSIRHKHVWIFTRSELLTRSSGCWRASVEMGLVLSGDCSFCVEASLPRVHQRSACLTTGGLVVAGGDSVRAVHGTAAISHTLHLYPDPQDRGQPRSVP